MEEDYDTFGKEISGVNRMTYMTLEFSTFSCFFCCCCFLFVCFYFGEFVSFRLRKGVSIFPIFVVVVVVDTASLYSIM